MHTGALITAAAFNWCDCVQAGITDVDALQVQLFLRGYAGVTPKLRRATENEFRRAKGSLNSSMRSTYLDRLGPVPEGRRRSILRSLGKPDPQLGAGGDVRSPGRPDCSRYELRAHPVMFDRSSSTCIPTSRSRSASPARAYGARGRGDNRS